LYIDHTVMRVVMDTLSESGDGHSQWEWWWTLISA
jgi:hypothetical protein